MVAIGSIDAAEQVDSTCSPVAPPSLLYRPTACAVNKPYRQGLESHELHSSSETAPPTALKLRH